MSEPVVIQPKSISPKEARLLAPNEFIEYVQVTVHNNQRNDRNFERQALRCHDAVVQALVKRLNLK